MRYVSVLFRIPMKQYRKISEKRDVLTTISNVIMGFSGKVSELKTGKRYVEYIISIPEEKYYELQSRGSVEALIEKKLIEKLKLKQSGIYVFPIKPKYITRYTREKYQRIALWKELYNKILKYSKEENMTINEFIKHLIELYEQLRGVGSG